MYMFPNGVIMFYDEIRFNFLLAMREHIEYLDNLEVNIIKQLMTLNLTNIILKL